MKFRNVRAQVGRRRVAMRLSAAYVVAVMAATGLFRTMESALRADDKAAVGRPEFEEEWEVVLIGNTRVGFGRSSIARKVRDGKDIVATDAEMTLSLSRLGQPVKIKTVSQTEETPEGDLLEFRFEMLNPPAAPMRRAARVENGMLILETEIAGKKNTSKTPWDNAIKSPGYQERVFRENPLKAGEKRAFKAYSPEFGVVATITLEAGKIEAVKMFDGKTEKLLAVTIKQSVVPGVATQAYTDGAGRILKTSTAMLGLTQATYRVAKDEALKALSGEEVDLAVASLVKTTAIDRPHETRRVVYRITTPGEDPSAFLVACAAQKLTRVGPHVVDLTVESLVPPEKAPDSSVPPAKEFLSPNNYLQSDDELVRRHATEAAGDEADPWKAAKLMERWVSDNLKKKNFSTLLASAAEVAKDLSGDCTEHAVLLAAMARARGIPSRVAVGLVYAPRLSAFGGHMWTEVSINGAWVPLDATLGNGGIGADHIKFADSSFADEGDSAPLTAFLPLVTVLGKMQIEVKKIEYDK